MISFDYNPPTEPKREKPTPLVPSTPEITPEKWKENPTHPNPNIPEHTPEPIAPPSIPIQPRPEPGEDPRS